MSLIEEARADIQQWREEDSALDTLVKLVEVVVGFGIIARAACHVVGHLAVNGRTTEYPDVEWGLTKGLAVEDAVGLQTEAMMRLCASAYGLFWALEMMPISVGAGSPAANAVIQGVVWVNVLVLVVDPVFLGSGQS